MNKTALPMDESDLGQLLFSTACYLHDGGCIVRGCMACTPLRNVWWDTFNRLAPHYQDAVVDSLSVAGVVLPITLEMEDFH